MAKKKLDIKIDQKKCIGCGTCTEIYPDAFKLNFQGQSEVTPLVSLDPTKLDDVVKSCPSRAIAVKK